MNRGKGTTMNRAAQFLNRHNVNEAEVNDLGFRSGKWPGFTAGSSKQQNQIADLHILLDKTYSGQVHDRKVGGNLEMLLDMKYSSSLASDIKKAAKTVIVGSMMIDGSDKLYITLT